MSVTVTLNGQTHIVPTVREIGWGSNVTGYLQDIAEVLDGTFQNISASSPVTTIDWDNGKNVHLNLGISTSLNLLNPRVGRGSIIHIVQGGAFTISWPSNVKWLRGGIAPIITTTAGRRDIVTLVWDAIDLVYVGEFSQNAPA